MPTLPTIGNDELAITASEIEALFSDFASEQETYKSANGKYEAHGPAVNGNAVTMVVEYLCPNSMVGWQVYIKDTSGDNIRVVSFGVGCESSARSCDWVTINE